jgi:hypothetical protein
MVPSNEKRCAIENSRLRAIKKICWGSYSESNRSACITNSPDVLGGKVLPLERKNAANDVKSSNFLIQRRAIEKVRLWRGRSAREKLVARKSPLDPNE